MQPLVSILINNYNYGHFLADAIDSALNQTYENLEVIVVDDGSTDDSHAVLKRYGDRIKTVLKPNGGQASSFNAGFSTSRGEILCLLDADDWFVPDKVEQVVAAFATQAAIGWCFHPLQLLDVTASEVGGQTVAAARPTGESGCYDVSMIMQQRGKLSGQLPFAGTATSGLCFRRSLLAKILPMPEEKQIALSDDYLKYLALGLTSGYVLLKDLAVQRLHQNNAFTLRSDKQSLRAKIHVLTAYWMRHNFPVLSLFANNLFATGRSMYWRIGQTNGDDRALIAKYWAQTTWRDRGVIHLKTAYYRYKP